MMLFTAVAGISVGLVKGFNKFTGEAFGGVAYTLSEKLTTGVCPKLCFDNNYENKIQ